MEIKVSKNELAGALSALGKLVSRTSPVEALRSVEIVGKENKVTLRTANAEESIAFSLDAEVSESFAVLVNFDGFRTVVRNCRNKTLAFSIENGAFAIDGASLEAVDGCLPELPAETIDCVRSALPAGFVGMLATAAPIVDRSNYRKVLQGLHLCPEGIVVTNGKELLHIEADLQIVPFTIPFPLALMAVKCDEAGMLATWAGQEYRYFRMEVGRWSWTAKALVGSYPAWKHVLPETAQLTHLVAFDEKSAVELGDFLKTVPENPPNNPVTLTQGKDGLDVEAGSGLHISVAAEFTVPWNGYSVSMSRNILQRLLQEGHRKLAFGEDHGAFTAEGGIGHYVAMPLACLPKTIVQPKQEEKQMNENITNVVTAPVQSVVSNVNPEPVTVNPLDELANAVDEFKTRIRAMFDESAILSRKVKEVALSQKQKERDFIQAKRAIERIRMAI